MVENAVLNLKHCASIEMSKNAVEAAHIFCREENTLLWKNYPVILSAQEQSGILFPHYFLG